MSKSDEFESLRNSRPTDAEVQQGGKADRVSDYVLSARNAASSGRYPAKFLTAAAAIFLISGTIAIAKIVDSPTQKSSISTNSIALPSTTEAPSPLSGDQFYTLVEVQFLNSLALVARDKNCHTGSELEKLINKSATEFKIKGWRISDGVAIDDSQCKMIHIESRSRTITIIPQPTCTENKKYLCHD
jgi:hypothetical protein